MNASGSNQSTESTGSRPGGGLSTEARNLQWLLTNLVEEVPGVRSVAVISSDGLMLCSSDAEPAEAAAAPGAPPGGKPSGPARASGDDILDQMVTLLQTQYGASINQTLADQAAVR